MLALTVHGAGRVAGYTTRKAFGPGKHQMAVADAAHRLDVALGRLTAALRQRDAELDRLRAELELCKAELDEPRRLAE